MPTGKSTAVEILKKYVLETYTNNRTEKKMTVVLLHVNLPTLRDPLGGVFTEGARDAYGTLLKPNQIQDLFERVREGTVEIVFLLDSYDELRQEALWKNLYRTNSLEQFRSEQSSKSFPKVVITSRSELFAAKPNYLTYFYPVETQEGSKKKKDDECRPFIHEVRFVPFGDKRKVYQRQFTALQWRNKFFSKLGVLNDKGSYVFMYALHIYM